MGRKSDSDDLTLNGRNIERKDIREIIAEKRAASEAFRVGYDARRATLEVSRELARLREEKRVSQEELAKRMHTTQQSVSRMESPDYERHSLRLIRKYAAALGMRPVITFEAVEPASSAKFSGATSKRSRKHAAQMPLVMKRAPSLHRGKSKSTHK